MRKVFVLLVLTVLVGGCATTTRFGNRTSGTQSYVFSTAPKDVTYDSCLSAMTNLKYAINNTDKETGMIIGSYTSLSFKPTRLTVNLAEVNGKTKVSIVVKQEGSIDNWDILGYYYKYQDAFYKKLKEELNLKSYDIVR